VNAIWARSVDGVGNHEPHAAGATVNLEARFRMLDEAGPEHRAMKTELATTPRKSAD